MSDFLMNLIFIITQGQLSRYYVVVESAIKMILFKRSLKLASASSTFGPALGGISRASWSFIVLMRMSHAI
jgi:hypothetical protein